MKNIERDENFLDWMFNVEDKKKQFEDILDFMKEVYLQDTNDWIVAASFGKDSSLLLQ